MTEPRCVNCGQRPGDHSDYECPDYVAMQPGDLPKYLSPRAKRGCDICGGLGFVRRHAQTNGFYACPCVRLVSEDDPRIPTTEVERIIKHPGEYHREVVCRLAADLLDARHDRDSWRSAAVKYLERAIVASDEADARADEAGRGKVARMMACAKVPHSGGGYLHDENDDGPYDIDGVSYCGRCHHFIDAIGACSAPALVAS